MSKRVSSIAGLVLSSVVAAGCAPSSGSGEQAGSLDDMEPVTLRTSLVLGEDHAINQAFLEYGDAVTEATDGKIEFEWYHSSSLVGPLEIPDAMADGVVNLTHPYPNNYPDVTPVNAWSSEAAFLEEGAPAGQLAGAGAHLEWTLTESPFAKEYEEKGMKFLGATLSAVEFGMICVDPVTTLEQAKGKKIRVGGHAWAAAVKELGMEPTFTPSNEVYEAMQRGLVDCMTLNMGVVPETGVWDYAKHFTMVKLNGWNIMGMVVDNGTWNSLPTKAQQIMWDLLPVFYEDVMEGSMQSDYDFVELAAKNGVELHEPEADLAGALQDHYDALLSGGLADAAPEGLSDPEGMIDRRLELSDKWTQIVADLGFENYDTFEEFATTEPDWTADFSKWSQAITEEIIKPLRPQS